jgi:hypothetical protein
MRKFFFSALVAITATGAALSQSNIATIIAFGSKDSTSNQKFYFPVANYSDSEGLNMAMPRLAEQVLANYHETNKRTYFDNCISYCLLSENYSKALEMVDSVRQIDNDKSYDIEVTSYALAKITERKNQPSFGDAFKTEFSKSFNELSFAKKANLAAIDSAD